MAHINSAKRTALPWERGKTTKARKTASPKGLPGTVLGLGSEARVDQARIWDSNREPALADVLADPLVWKVMDRDGLTPQDVAVVMASTRARLTTGTV